MERNVAKNGELLKLKNTNGVSAQQAYGLLRNSLGVPASEMKTLGAENKHPMLKLFANLFEEIGKTPITKPIEDLFSKERNSNAKKKISVGAYPLSLMNKKNAAKNSICNILAKWESNPRNAALLNQNEYLLERVKLIRNITSFVGEYDNTVESKEIFNIIEKYNNTITAQGAATVSAG